MATTNFTAGTPIESSWLNEVNGVVHGSAVPPATQTVLDLKAPIANATFTGTTTIPGAAITGGSVTGITDLAVADGGTGSSTAAGARTNLGAAASGANSDITSLSALTSINGGQLAGLRNKIINGNPLINQRGAASASTAYAAGVYFLDRWKAGASGATLSFATSNNVVTITVTAGSIIQVVEGLNLASGTHILSWSGTAQGRIDGGAYGATGRTATATGGTNMTVEFNTGTVSLVQLEPGSVATPFEHRPYGTELALCERYYEVCNQFTINASAGASGAAFGHTAMFSVPKRVAPTIALASTSMSNATGPTTDFITTKGFRLYVTASAVAGCSITTNWTASAEL